MSIRPGEQSYEHHSQRQIDQCRRDPRRITTALDGVPSVDDGVADASDQCHEPDGKKGKPHTFENSDGRNTTT